jgi:hypothetical protein
MSNEEKMKIEARNNIWFGDEKTYGAIQVYVGSNFVREYFVSDQKTTPAEAAKFLRGVADRVERGQWDDPKGKK